eukprot:CAMPEP_0198357566 /NCGR_PEP_ID=MMETSP1450-20131203/127374_1 /TAXON_ID=753684 ORGANISM="Madagascaria erythrocladiodes, Strain CCMP3234" /NCGR_SAMPLE_ID=MMETSP1450 /ASSEMBLY_ACC=CAM_ASM_001115 /LENGTH=98 /DNA_ID=CAMNT_0044064209 /DNA_START=382 /DNA_END=675 /DNA_ORIENTATION=-
MTDARVSGAVRVSRGADVLESTGVVGSHNSEIIAAGWDGKRHLRLYWRTLGGARPHREDIIALMPFLRAKTGFTNLPGWVNQTTMNLKQLREAIDEDF